MIALEEAGGAAGYRHGSTAVFAQGVVVRGGWDYATSLDRRIPGLTLDAVAWMHRPSSDGPSR